MLRNIIQESLNNKITLLNMKRVDWRDVIGWILLGLAVILLVTWFVK